MSQKDWLRVRTFTPPRAAVRPGSVARFTVELETRRPVTLRARLELRDLDMLAAVTERRLHLPAGGSARRLAIALPQAPRRGYSVHLRLSSRSGATLAAAETPIEAIDGWWESPRHACLTNFAPGIDPEPAVGRLAEWNVNVAQFYDWMYRHYRYRSPHDRDFVDALGRQVSPRTVRAAIRACHARGLAALAYGSVYGAEREYIERHPREAVLHRGRLASLGETFFLTDLRPGSPWRHRLLREYEKASRRLGFDGVHMDQYGEAFQGYASEGRRLGFASVFRGLIDEADARVRATHARRRVLFNAVGGWPLERIATSAAAATYLELWPPDVRYRDIVRQVDLARSLAPSKAVVVAAYLSALQRNLGDPEARAGAIEAALLLTSVILAGGAYHHVLAEGDRLLVEGYYPTAQALTRDEAEELRAAWRFSARFLHAVHGPDRVDTAGEQPSLRAVDGRPLPTSQQPKAGSVWTRSTALPDGRRVVQLVDLRHQTDDRWDAIKAISPPAERWLLEADATRTVCFASPWSAGGRMRPLRPRVSSGSAEVELPRFRRLAMLIIE